MMHFLAFIWNHYLYFGESRVALPLAAWVAVCFAMAGQGWRVLRWSVAFATGGALLLGLKAAFSYTGWSVPALGLYSVSGHAMLTAAVYPVLLMLLGSTLGKYTAWLGAALGVCIALIMPVVLVTELQHTVSEAFIGLGVGFVIAAVTLWRWQPVRLVHVGATMAVLVPLAYLVDPRDAVEDFRAGLQARVAKWTGVSGEYVRSIDPDPATGKRVVSVGYFMEDGTLLIMPGSPGTLDRYHMHNMHRGEGTG